jgi:hypothetical protein
MIKVMLLLYLVSPMTRGSGIIYRIWEQPEMKATNEKDHAPPLPCLTYDQRVRDHILKVRAARDESNK